MNIAIKLYLTISLCFVLKAAFGQDKSYENGILKSKPSVPDSDFYTNLKRYKYSEIKTWKYTFPNGVNLILRPDDSQPNIAIKIVAPGGAVLSPDADFQSAMHAGILIQHSGFEALSATAFQLKMDSVGINITPKIYPFYSSIEGNCTLKSLETALQVIYLYFTKPQKDKTYFDSYINGLKHELTKVEKDPSYIFQSQIEEQLWGNRIDRLSKTSIDQINIDKALEIYKKCFGDASNFTFVFTGNLLGNNMNEPYKLAALFQQYLGTLSSSPTKNTSFTYAKPIPSGKIEKNYELEGLSSSSVHLTYSGNYQYGDSINLQLKVLTDIIEHRLNDLSIFSSTEEPKITLSLNKFPYAQYAFHIDFDCSNDQIEQTKIYLSTIIKSLQTTITADEIKISIDKKRKELKRDFLEHKWWSVYLASQFLNDADPYEIASYPYDFRMATVASVTEAAKQYLNAENLIQLIATNNKL